MQDKRIAMIGLDTSHCVEFTKLMQSPDGQKRMIDGMRVTKALRFPSAFQPEEGQDKRQAELEAMGVDMVPTVDAALEEVDAVFLEINDPALHWTYFREVAPYGLPVFIDKPLAANGSEGRLIRELAEKHKVPVWSSSSLRFIPPLIQARQQVHEPVIGHAFGALGKAAAGSDLIWYGVHTIEMLTASLGTGAESVHAVEDAHCTVMVVGYPDGRRGIAECLPGLYRYGGRIQSRQEVAFFDSGGQSPYPALMKALRDFVCEGIIPVPLQEAQEVLAILEAAQRSLDSGKPETVVY